MKTFAALTSLLFVVAKAEDTLEALFTFNDLTAGSRVTMVDGEDGFGANDIPGVIRLFGAGRTSECGMPQSSTASTTAAQLRTKYDAVRDGVNSLTAFDSACKGGPASQCTGDDADLFQLSKEMTLILQEDLTGGPPYADPDDSARGGCFYLDFSQFGFGGSADVLKLTILDVDETAFDAACKPTVTCLKREGDSPEIQFVPEDRLDDIITTEGGFGVVSLMDYCEGTELLEVCLPGSGAIDNLKIVLSPQDKCPPFLEDDEHFKYTNKWGKRITCEDVATSYTKWRCKNKEHVKERCAKTCCKVPPISEICKEPDCGGDVPYFRGNYCYWRGKSCEWIDNLPHWATRWACKYFYDYHLHKRAWQACPETCGCHE